MRHNYKPFYALSVIFVMVFSYMCDVFLIVFESICPTDYLAKWVIEILPLTHTSECIRAAALDWSFPWISLAVLLVYGAAFYLLSLYALRQSN